MHDVLSPASPAKKGAKMKSQSGNLWSKITVMAKVAARATLRCFSTHWSILMLDSLRERACKQMTHFRQRRKKKPVLVPGPNLTRVWLSCQEAQRNQFRGSYSLFWVCMNNRRKKYQLELRQSEISPWSTRIQFLLRTFFPSKQVKYLHSYFYDCKGSEKQQCQHPWTHKDIVEQQTLVGIKDLDHLFPVG